MPRPRHPRREGVLLGLVVATSIWLWLAVVDAIAGQPFRTFIVLGGIASLDRKSTRLNSSHSQISYAVFCLKKKTVPQQAHIQSSIASDAQRYCRLRTIC